MRGPEPQVSARPPCEVQTSEREIPTAGSRARVIPKRTGHHRHGLRCACWHLTGGAKLRCAGAPRWAKLTTATEACEPSPHSRFQHFGDLNRGHQPLDGLNSCVHRAQESIALMSDWAPPAHLNCTEWARGERLSHSRPCRPGLPDRAPRQAMGRTTAGGRREPAPLRGGTSSVTGNGLGIRVASDTEARAAPDTCFPTAAARTVVGRLRFRTRTLGPGAREASRPRRANRASGWSGAGACVWCRPAPAVGSGLSSRTG